MPETSLSLLNRLQQDSDSVTWNRLVGIYSPLIHRWLKLYDVQASDVDDIVQEVLMALSTEMPKFEHNGRPGAFRSWLRTTLVHRVRNYWRARAHRPRATGGSSIDQRLAALENPNTEIAQIWNRQHDRHVLGQLLANIEQDFAPSTWQAFRLFALQDRKASEVAAELGISQNAVFIAKSRILNRLRQEAEGMVESSSDFSASR